MSWQDLNNDLSDPNYSNNSVIKSYISKGITNFFPFKIVTLKWLVDTQKAYNHSTMYQQTNAGKFLFYLMTFSTSDNYLPLGDCLIKDGTPLDKVWILLIKNDAKYSTLIDESAWQYVSRSRGCNGTDVYWSTRAVKDSDRNYGAYKVVGDVFVTWNHWDGWWPVGTKSITGGQGISINNKQARPFAAVDPRYLSTNSNTNRDTSSTIILDLVGDYSCSYHQKFNLTSPFNTFNISADEDTGGGQRNFDGVWGNPTSDNKYWPKYYFFDIVPRFLIADCCSNNLDTSINKNISCGVWKDPNSDSCKLGMKNYCVGDNLTQISCMEFCKTADCDTNIKNFCNPPNATYYQKKQKYTNYKDLCSCFMDSDFYRQKDEEYYNSLGTAGQQLVQLLKASGVYGGRPECSDLQCKAGVTVIQPSSTKTLSCPNVAIQNCINQQASDVSGKITATNLDQSQANNCVQQSQTTNNLAPSNTPPSPGVQSTPSGGAQPIIPQPPKQPLDTNKLMLIGGVIVVFLILLIIVLLKK